jgi:DNA-directed RNA polymerase specialized sigma24 family protein
MALEFTSWAEEHVHIEGGTPIPEPAKAAPLPRPAPDPTPEESALDLRRKESRTLTDLLLTRGECLPRCDRELLRLVYADGKRATEAGMLLSEHPRKVRRRLKDLAERLVSPRFEFVARQRSSWPPTRRKVATHVYLHGLSLRETCARLGLTNYVVRRHCDVVDGMFEAAHTTREAG